MTDTRCPANTSRRVTPRQNGFSMVEALITVLIFAIGLLSVAGLQAVAKRSVYESAQRTTAAQLGNALLEKMRANPRALATYVTAGTLGGGSLGAAPAPCDDPLDPCSADQLARVDLWRWEQQLDGLNSLVDGQAAGGLLTPSACIRGPVDGSAGMYTLVVAWQGSATQTNEVNDACGAGRYGADDATKRIAVFSTYLDPLS
ncbi:MAG: type IV pilus modification protein PilV [Gammaproteobacteria bacterium]|jgi:type IV pilus assembly protein PilV